MVFLSLCAMWLDCYVFFWHGSPAMGAWVMETVDGAVSTLTQWRTVPFSVIISHCRSKGSSVRAMLFCTCTSWLSLR